MARVTLLLGGNEGDVKRTLQAAQQLVNARVGAVLRCSHRYESEPWGFASAARFSNQALEITTDLSPLEVLDAVQRIECDLGRNRAAEAVEKASTGAAYTSRPIDIDIIFYDDEVIDDERLWLDMLDARNSTSHIYDDRQAAAVMSGVQERYYKALRALASLYGL